MKTGILTFHNTLNYGAQLQAYALQQTLLGMGLDCEVIDYRNSAVSTRETPLKPGLAPLLRHPRSSLRRFPVYRDLSVRRSKFQDFTNRFLRIGPRVGDASEIANRYGMVVVGSDQVWNPLCTDGDLTYFLQDSSFEGVCKVAYAASFGSGSFPQQFAESCGKAIRKFNSISVREEDGVSIVKELSGRRAELVLDPTLLLDRNAWTSMGEKESCGRYVFAYIVGERDRTLAYAREAAKILKADLIVIDCYRRNIIPSDYTYRNDASLVEFLGLIRDAELVVTSSFHGLALSLSLETNVRYCLNPAKNNRNSRLETLATLAGVELCNGANGIGKVSIDFNDVRKRLKEQRDKSFDFLSHAIN